jgi:urease accessory protein
MSSAPCQRFSIPARLRRLHDWAIFAAVALWPGFAYAHSRDEAGSFTDGLLHPLRGGDHLLAMLGVGIISVLLDKWAVFWVPGSFVLSMIIGGVLGVLGVSFPHLEIGIALSVLTLGVGIAGGRRLPLLLTMIVVAFFGCIHGNAHGVEMPSAASPVFYSFGFLITTVIIHLCGVGIGFLRPFRLNSRVPMGLVGGLMSLAGLFFLGKAFH